MPTIDSVEPVEINAGAWYLRAPRQDELIDDRPALASMGETDPGYIARCAAQWAADSWVLMGGLRTDHRRDAG